jgi:hypothetical protein
MRPYLKSSLQYVPLFLILALTSSTQAQFTRFGSKSTGSKQQSDDQKASKLLHDKLPLVLDANTAYPTVPDQDMLGGPFHPTTLPITLNTLTKPLPPGDYVLPMTFFCSEYSVHRGGNGIAYQLGPAQGTAAKAISTLLWRGMLTGHKPQELQSVSWAIQGSVSYDKMPLKYRALVDQLIPEMKNQVNGQAFADIEDGFQGKVNRFTKKVSDGISKGTGGFVHADIKVDVELNQSFERLGQIGRSATDGEKINTIFSAAFPSDQARDQALYAGQGQQSPALPAANGPWSVKVPGVAYMRLMVHGGNLQGDNAMQIRILPPRASQALVDERPHLVLAGYKQNQQSTSAGPSVISLFNGSVNDAALSQCQATPMNQQMCMAQAITVSGDMGYSIGAGAQAPIMAPSGPVQPVSPSHKVCVKKALYEPTALLDGGIGLCIYLAVVNNVNNSCNGSQVVDVAEDQTLNWVQTFQTSADGGCTPGISHKDPCSRTPIDTKQSGPLYRPNHDNDIFVAGSGNPAFDQWKQELSSDGELRLIFRDVPSRQLGSVATGCGTTIKLDDARCSAFTFHTVSEDPAHPTNYYRPAQPPSFQPSNSPIDNDLRLVRYPSMGGEPSHFDYSPLIKIRYGFAVDRVKKTITVEPLYIGSLSTTDSSTPVVSDTGTPEKDEVMADGGGTISISRLTTLSRLSRLSSLTPHSLPTACSAPTKDVLNGPPLTFSDFPYDKP